MWGVCMDKKPLYVDDKPFKLYLRVTPKAAKERIKGTVDDADGQTRLRVYVTAAPENGKANRAVLALLAKALQLPKSDLSILQGKTDRDKMVAIASDIPDIAERIDTLLIIDPNQRTLALF